MTIGEPNNDSALPADASAVDREAEGVFAASASDHGPYSVKLPVFEGPLDLLLHLIRQNEVEITDIPVALISQQYLEYLEIMKMLDLDIAGEYLVMAATLALIKSRMLLPPDEDEEGEDGIDPRAELVARLLEYQRYKEVAEDLSKRRLLGRDVFNAQGLEPEPIPDAEREIAVDVFQLIEAFRRILASAREGRDSHVVETETVRVRERMVLVMELLATADSVEFTQVFELADGAAPTRAVVVATFLAILELAKLEALRLYQGLSADGSPEGVIRLRSVEASGQVSWANRLAGEI